jgi:hypothetical protein
MEENTWSINQEIVIDFDNYAPDFSDVQPPFAEKSCLSLTEISPWTNRVPAHEPWPRVLKQDTGDGPQNKENDGYKNNTDWIDQYDNETRPEGREPIGVVEGDQKTERGPLWRR